MTADEIKRIRDRLEISRDDMAEILCLGYRSLMHIELKTRNASKLTVRLLRYIDSLSKAKALAFIEELKSHEPK
jgi:DNA-binding transcriptional regulator YiaG